MRTLRQNSIGDPQQSVIPSVLELYGSYLVANDWSRIHTGISHHQNGSWLSSQLEGFTTAWKHFEALTGFGPILAPSARATRYTKCGTSLGLPELALLTRPVLLPHWREVRTWLATFPDALATLASAPHEAKARLWRRWEVGTPNSHLSLQGYLPCSSILCSPSDRIPRKMPRPAWETQLPIFRKFITRLQHLPCALAPWPAATGTVADYLAHEGALRHVLDLSQWHLQIAQRAKTLLRCAKKILCHVILDPYNHRPLCILCQQSSYTTFPAAWLGATCSHRVAFCPSSLDTLVQQMHIAEQRAAALDRLSQDSLEPLSRGSVAAVLHQEENFPRIF